MTPFFKDGDFTLYVGDARDALRDLPDESINCVATSPPFYGLRDYQVQGQIGLEATPEVWAAELVPVFAECRRVLRRDGVMFVECGDSYAQIDGTSYAGDTRDPGQNGVFNVAPSLAATKRSRKSQVPAGYKRKDLIGAPWLLAFALRADGWYLRQALIWHKPNAMPESVTDRCTTAHSYVFLFSKSARYWFDAEAISEPASWQRWGDQTVPKYEGTETTTGWMQPRSKAELRSGRVGAYQNPAMYGNGDGTTPRKVLDEAAARKNARSVWTIPTQGYPGAHFATWPEALVERIILAGCPAEVCRACGKPRERLLDVSPMEIDRSKRTHALGRTRSSGTMTKPREASTAGWSDCGCGQGFQPGTILDPFMGSGTTALVARKHGRRSIGIELNEEYARLCLARLSVPDETGAVPNTNGDGHAQMSLLG